MIEADGSDVENRARQTSDGIGRIQGAPACTLWRETLSRGRVEMRFGWMAVTCASLSCSHVSTSDYGVAAAFAGVAGALQVAEEASKGQSTPSCDPRTCGGCCDLADRCVDGTTDRACGSAGSVCRNCAANGHQVCGAGACSPTSAAGGSQGSSNSTLASGSVRPQSSTSCTQIVAVCFPGTYSACEIDANGCQRCNCLPETRFDWDTAP
jgi:hypothetical protein